MANIMTRLTTLKYVIILFMFYSTLYVVNGKKHKLKVEDDQRRVIDLTTFGFLQDGFIQVIVQGFNPGISSPHANLFGFTLDKMSRAGMSSLEDKDERCLLTAEPSYFVENDIAVLVFSMDFTNSQIKIVRNGEELRNLTLLDGMLEAFDSGTTNRDRRSTRKLSDSYLLTNRRHKRELPADKEKLESTTTGPIKPNVSAVTNSPQRAAGVTVSNNPKPKPGVTIQPKPEVTQSSLVPSKAKPKVTQPNAVPSKAKPEATQPSVVPSKTKPKATEPNAVPEKAKPKATESSAVTNKTIIEPKVVSGDTISMYKDENGNFGFNFTVEMITKDTVGLYKFTYLNCAGDDERPGVNFTIFLIEKNGDNYLSAGHIPLPTMYFILSVVFLGLACSWLYVLKKSTEGVYKLHYLMLALVYIKSLALLFHAVNYYFLATQGHHEEAIAIIYYITYLMRGILLFVTIVLIGAGWAFVKYILSDRDKKIFLIVIPLQILANVAQIIIEETEEGESQYLTWSEIFIVVDLLCCGAILFPVVWSIRHLQEASETDGKAAINLVKLKLFRHFYILIVCYIYFTRIIVYLLRIAVPFQYEWMDDFFREAATLVFYLVTGYKFRPASNNPYLQVPQDSDDEVEMDEVVTQSGVLEGISKVNVKVKSDNGDTSCGVSKRESSHDYD